MSMLWCQHELTLPSLPRGFHLITSEVLTAIPELRKVRAGFLQVFLQHTSASLTINENASPEVGRDLESSINTIVPERFPYEHSLEGPDDMPAHIKSSLFGPALLIPVQDGKLGLGTWQGIYLCEHRDRGGRRKLLLTLCGSGTNARD